MGSPTTFVGAIVVCMITTDQLAGLDHTLNEARLREVYIHEQRRLAQIWLECLAVSPEGDEPEDPLVCVQLNGVSRIAVSLRNANRDDRDAPPVPVALEDLSDVVRSLGGTDLYGWEFFDLAEESWSDWRERLSLDAVMPGDRGTHTVTLFQEQGVSRHLDLRLWFADLWVTRRDETQVDVDQLNAASRRWWDAMYAGDPRVQGHGIVRGGG
jgi:hypothetical protein